MDKEVAKNLTTEERLSLSRLKEDLEYRFGTRLTKLVLFGSKARGDFGPTSDLDVAIVIKTLSFEEKNEVFKMVSGIELENLTPISTLVLSEEVFLELHNRERRIALDIETEGIPL